MAPSAPSSFWHRFRPGRNCNLFFTLKTNFYEKELHIYPRKGRQQRPLAEELCYQTSAVCREVQHQRRRTNGHHPKQHAVHLLAELPQPARGIQPQDRAVQERTPRRHPLRRLAQRGTQLPLARPRPGPVGPRYLRTGRLDRQSHQTPRSLHHRRRPRPGHRSGDHHGGRPQHGETGHLPATGERRPPGDPLDPQEHGRDRDPGRPRQRLRVPGLRPAPELHRHEFPGPGPDGRVQIPGGVYQKRRAGGAVE